MNQNFDSLKSEIEQYLKDHEFVIFHGCSRAFDSSRIDWDCDHYPDYTVFLDAARRAGARLIVFHHREFSGALLDDAAEHLEAADLPREEKRAYERRLQDLSAYKGFTCAIELSFDYEGASYVYDLRTSWYDELEDIMDELGDYGDEDEEDNGPIGGYFSRN